MRRFRGLIFLNVGKGPVSRQTFRIALSKVRGTVGGRHRYVTGGGGADFRPVPRFCPRTLQRAFTAEYFRTNVRTGIMRAFLKRCSVTVALSLCARIASGGTGSRVRGLRGLCRSVIWEVGSASVPLRGFSQSLARTSFTADVRRQGPTGRGNWQTSLFL